jgi:hypothetical protein
MLTCSGCNIASTAIAKQQLKQWIPNKDELVYISFDLSTSNLF